MKSHNYGKPIPAMGYEVFPCLHCGAISIDKDLSPYAGMNDWRVVSEDCSRALKQIDLFSTILKEE